MNKPSDWDQFTRYFELLKNFSLGLQAAMKLRPCPGDYDFVEYHLPLYAIQKAMFWPGSLCWYDNHNIYHVAYMMRKWGSLGLVSQEGMEGGRKYLTKYYAWAMALPMQAPYLSKFTRARARSREGVPQGTGTGQVEGKVGI